MENNYDFIIIGAGFYGLSLAENLAKMNKRVIIFEELPEVMSRASYVNQARVHNGYHYPRSLLTAFRSRDSYPLFCKEFKDAIHDEFDKYYLISNNLSKVNARQFRAFCDRIDVPIEKAHPKAHAWTDPKQVEEIFFVKETAFDSVKLKNIILARVQNSGVTIALNAAVRSVSMTDKPVVELFSGEQFQAQGVFNCTYSSINEVNKNSGFELLALKNELAEICIIDVPQEFKKAGFTVMCGPFFSVMPFPALGYHSLTHVRYTPHCSWTTPETLRKGLLTGEDEANFKMASNFVKMRADAARFLPFLREMKYVKSLFEVKTVLQASENTDSRPILFKENHGIKGYHCILGGKIDNVYDVASTLSKMNI